MTGPFPVTDPFPLRDRGDRTGRRDPADRADPTEVSIDAWTPDRVARIRPWLRPDAEWKQWDAPYLPGPGATEADAFAAGLLDHPWQPDPLTGRPQRLCVRVGDVAAGLVSWTWEDETAGWRRIGIVLYDPTTWGDGVGTRALRLWSDWLAGLPDSRRLDLSTWSGNVRMVRAARRCGFTDETRSRGAREVRGIRHDGLVLSRPVG